MQCKSSDDGLERRRIGCESGHWAAQGDMRSAQQVAPAPAQVTLAPDPQTGQTRRWLVVYKVYDSPTPPPLQSTLVSGHLDALCTYMNGCTSVCVIQQIGRDGVRQESRREGCCKGGMRKESSADCCSKVKVLLCVRQVRVSEANQPLRCKYVGPQCNIATVSVSWTMQNANARR